MKKIMIAVLMFGAMATTVRADDFSDEPLCKVQVCNKIERFSLSIMSHIKDSMGETCGNAIIPKSQAVVGNELSSESRWYQGSSINPTKKSVTRVKEVYQCQGDN